MMTKCSKMKNLLAEEVRDAMAAWQQHGGQDDMSADDAVDCLSAWAASQRFALLEDDVFGELNELIVSDGACMSAQIVEALDPEGFEEALHELDDGWILGVDDEEEVILNRRALHMAYDLSDALLATWAALRCATAENMPQIESLAQELDGCVQSAVHNVSLFESAGEWSRLTLDETDPLLVTRQSQLALTLQFHHAVREHCQDMDGVLSPEEQQLGSNIIQWPTPEILEKSYPLAAASGTVAATGMLEDIRAKISGKNGWMVIAPPEGRGHPVCISIVSEIDFDAIILGSKELSFTGNRLEISYDEFYAALEGVAVITLRAKGGQVMETMIP